MKRTKITRHSAPRSTGLLSPKGIPVGLAALLLAACSQLPTLAPTLAPPPTAAGQASQTATIDIEATNEVILATNEAIETFVMGTYAAVETLVAATETAIAAAETPSPAMTVSPAPLPIYTLLPDTIDFHLQISAGNQPLEASVSIYWPEIGGELKLGPTSDTVISLPTNADGVPIVLTVSAGGYLDVVQPLTPTEPFSLVVQMIEE